MNKETEFGRLKNYGITKPGKTGKLVEILYKTVIIDGLPHKMPRQTNILDTGTFSYLQMRKKYYINKGYLNLKITR